MSKSLYSLLIILFCVGYMNSARILCIFPVPFKSHQSVFHKLTEALSKNGHELVVMTPLRREPIENITDIELQDVSNDAWEKGYENFEEKGENYNEIIFWKDLVYPTMFKIVELQLRSKAMQDLINDPSQHFDLIILEACVRGNYFITERFKAPVVLASSFFGEFEYFTSVGAATHPLYFPDYTVQETRRFSIWNKIKAVYTAFAMRYMGYQMRDEENLILKRIFGNNATSLEVLKKNIHLIILNVHHIWDNNRPVPPAVHYLGALHLLKPKPLPQDLKNYLDNSNNGVIYMSLGSKLRSCDLPEVTVISFLKVFKSLPYNVVWKWEDEIPVNASKNIRFEKWLPQNDLLYHPKIKLFITHCGLQSTDEAIAAHVPMLGLPIFGDQFYNAQKYEQHKIGQQLNINDIKDKELNDTIYNIINDKSYKINLQKLSSLMELQREGSLDKAIKLINYVIEYGGQQLHSPIANVSTVEYYMIDALLVIASIIILVVIVTYTVVKYVLKIVLYHNKARKNKTA